MESSGATSSTLDSDGGAVNDGQIPRSGDCGEDPASSPLSSHEPGHENNSVRLPRFAILEASLEARHILEEEKQRPPGHR